MRTATVESETFSHPHSLIPRPRGRLPACAAPTAKKLVKSGRLMIDKGSGKVAYAVMRFGGFLGMGEKYHPLPGMR